MVKIIPVGNEYYLKINFCQLDKKPITKLKSTKKSNNTDQLIVAYPNDLSYEDVLCYQINEAMIGKRMIQDIEMIE